MAAFLYDPRRWAVKAVIVSGCEVHDGEKELVAVFDIPDAVLASSAADPGTADVGARAEDSGLDAHLEHDGGVVDETLASVVIGLDGGVLELAVLLWERVGVAVGRLECGGHIARRGRRGDAEELVEAVLDAVHVGEFAVGDDDLHVAFWAGFEAGGGGWWCFGRAAAAVLVDSEEGVEGVGEAFDLLDSQTLDGSEMQHFAVGRADLFERRLLASSGVWMRRDGRGQHTSIALSMGRTPSLSFR